MRTFICDLETYSSADLARTGVVKYTEAEDFEILLMSYAFDDEPVQVWDFTLQGAPGWLADVLTNPEVTKVAWNVAFERACLNRWLGVYTPPEQWRDAMTLSAMNGLPMSLEAAGNALQLTEKKLETGKALINFFCKPCRPTITNGGRTRNRPHHAPEKWAAFVEYCRRDTETERTIYNRLKYFPVPPWEHCVEALDARINERGVLVDLELTEAAVYIDDTAKAEHLAELKHLTGLENPNSVAQLKEWLETVGVSCESLNKATVADLHKTVTDPTTRRVLELRQLLGKTSTKKYAAIIDGVCKDQRVRGLLQYYGAGRTGRWAGRRLQLQNLAQNHLDNIDKVRELVRQRDLETLELAFDNVPDVLSQLIRTALIAKPGHTFLVSDYAAIEARVIAYLAGEQWRMDVFAEGGDIYCSSASQMFKVPVVKHGINGHLRQKGKIAELACIAEGQEVLTDVGLVPIEKVTTAMKLWDGIEWVNHDGVVYKGEKEVLTYGGLEATADHIVWAEVNREPRTVLFGDAATCGARLLRTGAGRHPVRLGRSNQPGEEMEREVEPRLHPDQVQRLRARTVAEPREPADGQVQGLPKLHTTDGGPALAGPTLHSCEAEMHEPEGCKLQELRREGHRVPLRERNGRLPLYGRNARPAVPRDGAGSDRRQRALRTGEPSLGDASRELSKPATLPRKVKVYDILNAGPRHRFTVSDVLVHNCGYGGGVNALKAFGADKMGLTEEEMQTIVTQWRQASPTIPRFWRNAEDAAKRAIQLPGTTIHMACGVKYRRDADALRCQLPSGRILSYWDARIEEYKDRPSIVFMGQNQTTRKWEKTETWGGKLVENIVQAFARDCLAVALLRLDEAGYQTVFHVHDEIVAEAPEGSRWQDMADIMGMPIDWAPGLLLRGDGYDTKFYMKD